MVKLCPKNPRIIFVSRFNKSEKRIYNLDKLGKTISQTKEVVIQPVEIPQPIDPIIEINDPSMIGLERNDYIMQDFAIDQFDGLAQIEIPSYDDI